MKMMRMIGMESNPPQILVMVFVGEAGLFLKKVEFFDVACPHDSNLIIEKPANINIKESF